MSYWFDFMKGNHTNFSGRDLGQEFYLKAGNLELEDIPTRPSQQCLVSVNVGADDGRLKICSETRP